MARHDYATATPRVGKIKGAILKHAIPKEVLGITGNMHKIGQNQSDTVVFRRFLPTGGSSSTTPDSAGLLPINDWNITAASHVVQEGVTPSSETIAPQDITVTLNQYACLYQYSDKTARLYEDRIPDHMKVLTGERMGLVRELIRYGVLKGCTNKYYAGGTSRATVDEALSLGLLRKVTRSLKGNRSKPITRILSASANYNTAPVESGYLVFVHTDGENDVRELPGFIACAEYGSRKQMHECEVGGAENFRFILTPELAPILASGAATGTTGLLDIGSAGNVDIYPFVVVADDAWGDVALRGQSSFGVTHIPVDKKDKNDPHGQRGYVGAIFWSASFIQNDGWMTVVEAGVTDL